MKPIEIKTDQEFVDYLANDDLKIVKFSASWCIPCKLSEPFFNEYASMYTDMKFYKVDVDDIECEDLNINALPTFIIFYKSKEFDRKVGTNKNDLKEFIENTLTNLDKLKK